MSARERKIVQAFVDRSGLPENALTVLCCGAASDFELLVWVSPSFSHALPDLPKAIRGVPVSAHVRPITRAYAERPSETFRHT
jgi:hypothetical protein